MPPNLTDAIVTAAEMRQIEQRLFDAGLPVAALMEKVAGRIAARIQTLYPRSRYPRIGILIGPGHNGGDALVIARELHHSGYRVALWQATDKLKDLPTAHLRYADRLGIPIHRTITPLQASDLIVDGLFGFGLERAIAGNLADSIAQINAWQIPIASIDLPSGIHTDTGATMGIAVRATHTLCLGLWKRTCFQDRALAALGTTELIDFDIPPADIHAILGNPPPVRILTNTIARQHLPIPREPTTHKYRQGYLLAIGGSQRYPGSIHLTALGARASGVGMLAIATPEAVVPGLIARLPEALALSCPPTNTGAIAALPNHADLTRTTAIACGPGITLDAGPLLDVVLDLPQPLVLDADALTLLAQRDAVATLQQRRAPTVLTPHAGEFQRLFPKLPDPNGDRLAAVRAAAEVSNAIVLLKGARTAIAHPNGNTWVVPISTPALARGGSGDVLAGLLGGLVAQLPGSNLHTLSATAATWHARAGVIAAREHTELGVDAFTLTQYLTRAAMQITRDP
ncbi:carbohydrate kinase, YjeF related protein [Rubidibacter lacunae KORDI 51-2]|uniref:Bifunctional NAD(P)H-hydrate repair enzyme n=1 Tax=Rubidibacter lacunae KORDI 51-2 TaxID=582515 RepID=U5DGP1_9CHRO|nr:bifunctional ADP-dependent NAD(P)H-hydrate dehydratase/NAD(P)H-hydrate epimerase [Rubidibacter lacunae]ERN40771.1 carbohydrate kinase, YjeF related protein [Rubidibacter lacunae KORDI 51-2]